MANPNIQINVGGNTAQLQSQINKIAKTPIFIDVRSNARNASSPLGRITGDIAEIDKSLAAANARVVAFAASAGAIYAVQAAAISLVKSFVDVEKRLTDINVLLNLSSQGLASFGSSLFKIAGNTAQSFSVVADAATELSRQGLGVEETLKRTEAALILTRLSGLEAAASVQALTAAVNSFSGSGLEAVEIVNKLANVDAGFAVSSADLANAISRVGSSASDAGVSFDELIALVATAQQVTARGGAVIGNSLKTIFTRLGRSETQNLLQGLGINLTDDAGNLKNQVQLLQELAVKYDTLSATQKNAVAEQVGGVFQINILKAALGDLGKEYSIYDQALRTSVSSTNEAIKRNEELNKTLAARGAKALTDIQQAGATIAQPLFKPLATNVLNISDIITGAVNNADTAGIGAKIGKGLLDGIGNFIGGPGLAIITAALGKLFGQFAKVGTEAFKSILGTNAAAKDQAAIQASVAKFLQTNAGLYSGIQKGQISVTSAAQQYLAVIQQQTAALQAQAALAAQISSLVTGKIGVQNVAGQPMIAPKTGKKLYSGFIPSFANNNVAAEMIGAMEYGYRPGKVVKERVYDGSGKSFMAYRNLAETRTDFINADGKKSTMITPPNGFSKDTLTAYSGFIPNFALNPTPYELKRQLNSKRLTESERQAIKAKLGENKKSISINLNRYSGAGSKYGVLFAQDGAGAARFSQQIGGRDTPALLRPLANAGVSGVITAGLRYRSIYPPNAKDAAGASASYSNKIDEFLQPGFNRMAQDVAANLGGVASNSPEKLSSVLPPGAKGTIFEKVVSAATRKPGPKMDKNINDNAPFDFDPISSYPLLNNLFGKNIGSAVEAKIGKAAAANLPGKILNQEPNIARQILKEYMPKEKKSLYRGYIPNFANNLQQAIDRERSAGVPSGSIYLSREKELKSANPLGIGVFNRKDEPNRMARKSAMSRQGFSSGFIPNFAEGLTSSSLISSDTSQIAMLSSSLLFSMAFLSQGFGDIGKDFKQLGSDFKSDKKVFLKDFFSKIDTAELENRKLILEEQSAKTQKTISGIEKKIQGRQSIGAPTDKLESRLDRQLSVMNAQKEQLSGIAKSSRMAGYQATMRTAGPGIGFAAQALSGVAAELLGGADTKAGASASALGNIGGFAGMGAMFGPKGMAVGAIVGALTSIPAVANAFNDNLQEATRNATKASASLARFQETSQQFLVASGELSSLKAQDFVAPSKLDKATDKYFLALSKLPEQTQERLKRAKTEAEKQEIIAQDQQREVMSANFSQVVKNLAQEAGGFKMFDFLGGFQMTGSSMNENAARAIGQDIGSILDIGGNAENAEERMSQLNDALKNVGAAGLELSSIMTSRNNDMQTAFSVFGETANSLGVALGMGLGNRFGRQPFGDDTKRARESFSQLLDELQKNSALPEAEILKLKAQLPTMTFDDIYNAYQGLADTITQQTSQALNAQRDKIAEANAFKQLPEAVQKYISNINSIVSKETAGDFLGAEDLRRKSVDIPRFQSELAKIGQNFLGQFTNMPMPNVMANIDRDFGIAEQEVNLNAVRQFATEFIPNLNNKFLELVQNKQIKQEDIAYVGSALQDMRQSILNAGSLNEVLDSEFWNRTLFIDANEVKGMMDGAMTNAASGLSSAMEQLNFEKQKAKAQAALDNAINKFTNAMNRLDAWGRSDLTGFRNPMRDVNMSMSDLQYDYQRQASQIRASAAEGADPRDVAQAWQDLNRQYNRGMAQLRDQADAVREASAREAIGFAVAGGADSSVVDFAINKYMSTINDRISEYAEYLGTSTTEVAKLIRAKLQKEAGMVPDIFKGLAEDIESKSKTVFNLEGASQGFQTFVGRLNEILNNMPSTEEAVNEMIRSLNATNDPLANSSDAARDAADALNTIPEPIRGAVSGVNDLGAQAAIAAVKLSRIPNPPNPSNPPSRPPSSNDPGGFAKGFIPNFASPSQINKTKKLEKDVSGKTPRFYENPFPHVRNSSQPTFESAMRDHGGVKQALLDSYNLQKQNKISGKIPGFAATFVNMSGGRHVSMPLSQARFAAGNHWTPRPWQTHMTYREMIAYQQDWQNRHRRGILRGGFGFGPPSNHAAGFVPNFADPRYSSPKEAISDPHISPPIKSKFDKIRNFFKRTVPNFSVYDPASNSTGNASPEMKNALFSMQILSAMVSQNLGLGFDKVGVAGSVNWSTKRALGGAGAMVRTPPGGSSQIYFARDEAAKGWLLGAIANESVHVNQSADDYQIQDLQDHSRKLKKFANFFDGQGMLYASSRASAYEDNRLAGYSYNGIANDRNISEIREQAVAMQQGRSKEHRNEFSNNANTSTESMSQNASQQYEKAKKAIDSIVFRTEKEIANFHSQMKKDIAQANAEALEWSRSQMDGTKVSTQSTIGSELMHPDQSKGYLIERFSSLMTALVHGIQFGSIVPEELVSPGIAKDIKQAEQMVNLVLRTEQDLRRSGQESATGFIPNFAKNSKKISEIKEKLMAKMHGYNAGRVMQKRIHDGSGNSFLGTVNSAETIDNFINSKGKKATLVTPPNGFAKGYDPGLISDSVSNATEMFTADTAIMSRKVQEASNAFENISRQETLAQMSNQSASSGPANANVVFANPVVSPQYTFQMNGLDGMGATLSSISQQVMAQYQEQAAKIDYVNQALNNLKFNLTKQAI